MARMARQCSPGIRIPKDGVVPSASAGSPGGRGRPWALSGAAIWILLISACGARVSQEKIDYQFRQAMIDPQWPSEANATRPSGGAAVSRSSVPAAVRRCRRMVGRRFPGPHAKALAQVIERCLGTPLAAAELPGRQSELRREPGAPGELILFHNTRDANQNRRLDDRFSDAGVVLARKDQRVTFIYLRGERVYKGVLNLEQPHRRRIARKIENTYLRVISPDDPPRTQYLAGQLLAGFLPRP